MRIRFLNSCMSSEGVFTARREYELSDELAAGFITAGHAVAAEVTEEATASETVEHATAAHAPVETASVAAAVETATKPSGRKARK